MKKINCSKSTTEVVYLRKEETYFTDETMQSLVELGSILRSIHDRLVVEGYTIKNGKIYKENVIQA